MADCLKCGRPLGAAARRCMYCGAPAIPPAPAPAAPPPSPSGFACPSCGTKLKIPESAAGKKVKCPKCGTTSVAEIVPEWAEFFTFERFQAFVGHVHRALTERKIAYTREGATLRFSDEPYKSLEGNLSNLAAHCNTLDPGEWAAEIGHFFDGMAERRILQEEFEAKAKDLGAVAKYLKVQVQAEGYAPEGVGISRPLATGLRLYLVFDLPDRVLSVGEDHVKAWGKPMEELFKVGIENVAQEPPPTRNSMPIPRGGTVELIAGESFFTATHVCFLERYLEGKPRYGVIVALPNRHTMLFHVVRDAGVLEIMGALLSLVIKGYRETDGPIAPGFYWWRPGEEMLPFRMQSQGGDINILPPLEFQRLFKRPS